MTSFNFRLMFKLACNTVTDLKNLGFRDIVKRAAVLLISLFFYTINETIHWTCLLLDELFFPDYHQVNVSEPVFIVGLPRSGTTHIHRLVAMDSQFTSFRLWEILLAPSIIQKKIFKALGAVDRKVGNPVTRRIITFEKEKLRNKFHETGLFKPEEDDPILLHIFSSFFLVFLFPFDEEIRHYAKFDLEIPPAERARIMDFYKKCVQRHLYIFGKEKKFLSKNPAFCSKIQSIQETFPDAKVVYAIRNPLQAVVSGMSLRTFWLDRFYASVSDCIKQSFISFILQRSQFYYEYPLKILSRWPEDRHAFVNYDCLKANPEKTVLDVYAQLGLNASISYRNALAMNRMGSMTYRSRHHYASEDFGISRDLIISRFQHIFDRFGFDKNT